MAPKSGEKPVASTPSSKPTPEFFEALIRENPDMIAVIDNDGRFAFISEAAGRILGMDVAEWIGADGFSIIHPDDIGVAAESLATTVADSSGVREPLLMRLRHVDGTWRHVEIITHNLTDDPRVEGLLISARDMDARRQSEATAAAARDLFEQAFDRAPIGMAIVDNDGTLRRVNVAFAVMLGFNLHELVGASLIRLAHREDREMAIEQAVAVVGGEDRPAFETRFIRADGTIAWARVTATLIKSDDGKPLHSVVQVEDVTEQQILREELVRAAAHDPLTGLLNRSGLESNYAEFLEEDPVESAFFLIDLDGFKPVNDEHGHAVGDKLLKIVSQRLTETIRDDEIIARIGGDEFVVHVKGVADAREALAIGERIRAALAAPFSVGKHRVRVTGSVGVALLVGGVDLEHALLASDRASYESKHAGGDQVSLAWANARD